LHDIITDYNDDYFDSQEFLVKRRE
jgi:hypothetical protein